MQKLIIFLASAFAAFLTVQSDFLTPQFNLDMLKAQYLPVGLSGMNFTADDARKILEQKCETNSGGNKSVFVNARAGVAEFMNCINGYANLTVIKEEMDLAKPIGELDTVFQKYCDKRQEAEMCFETFMKKVEPCLTKDEKEHKTNIVQVASKMLGLVCRKGGDQIALFVSEQGPECLEEHKVNISNCVNETFAGYVPKEIAQSAHNLPNLVLGKKECKDIDDFEKCVLVHLDKCSDITPGNMVEAMFRFIKNETKCELLHSMPLRAGNGGTSVVTSFLTILIVAVMVFLLK